MNKIMPFIMPLLRSVLFIVVGLLFAILTNNSLEETSRWWSVICTMCNIITILILILVCKKENSTYLKLIPFTKGQRDIKFTLSIVIIMLSLGMSGMYGFG